MPDWGRGVRSSYNDAQQDQINHADAETAANEGKSRGFRALARWAARALTPNGVVDSGATGHFLQKGVGIPTGKPSSKVVGMPNGQTERASEQVLLPINTLNTEARQGDELPSLRHNSLVSVPKLSDYGYTTVFRPGQEGIEVYESSQVQVVSAAEPVLRGWRDASGLWRTPLPKQITPLSSRLGEVDVIKLPQEQVNSIYHLPSVEARVAYIHACFGFPTKAAMLDAATAGRLIGIPFATVTNICKFYPETKETSKGHLDQQRQGVSSTKHVAEKQAGVQLTKEQDVYVEVWKLKNTTYSDQTGHFPYTSYKGNKYVMVMVEIDSSGILVEPLSDKIAEEMTRAYLHLLQRIKKTGVQPKKHVMDNEVSEALKEVIEKECKLELVPPGCHRRNVAEVAIKTF